MNCALFLAFYSSSPPQHLKYCERMLNLLAKWENILLRVNLAHFIFSIQHFSSIAFFITRAICMTMGSCSRNCLLLLLISYLKLLPSVCDILIISTTIYCDVTNGGLWLWIRSETEKLKGFELEKRPFSLKNKREDRMILVKWRQSSITFPLRVMEQLVLHLAV